MKGWEDLRQNFVRTATPGCIYVANAMLDLSHTLGFVERTQREAEKQTFAAHDLSEGCMNSACPFTKGAPPQRKMFKCTGCMAVKYCDEACQLK